MQIENLKPKTNISVITTNRYNMFRRQKLTEWILKKSIRVMIMRETSRTYKKVESKCYKGYTKH